MVGTKQQSRLEYSQSLVSICLSIFTTEFAALARSVPALSHASESEPVIRLSCCVTVTVTVAAAPKQKRGWMQALRE
jgi:hypothetical protein